MRLLTRIALVSAFVLSACHPRQSDGGGDHQATDNAVAPILTGAAAVDDQSFARPLEARVTHLALDLDVDFDTKRIGGTAALDIQHRPDAKVIVLDDNGLEIEAITDQRRRAVPFKVGPQKGQMGSPLVVALRPDTSRILLTYKSAANAGALLWLTPQQTVGKTAPFLLSQGEAIENRSWIPSQDSPGIRQSWEAAIRVPAGMTAVMSAPRPEQPITEGGEGVFKLNEAHNMEVRFAWLDLAVGNRYSAAVPSLRQYLTTQGRGKFVGPLFRALMKDDAWGGPIARRIYPLARPLHHPVVLRGLDPLFVAQKPGKPANPGTK